MRNDDAITPVDRPEPRHASDEALRVAYAGTLLAAIASELGAIGAMLDGLQENSREYRVRDVADQIIGTGAAMNALGLSLKDRKECP